MSLEQKAEIVAMGAAISTFKTDLAAAQASLATAAATVAADGGASGTSKSQVAAAAVLVAALSASGFASYCHY
jgi:hypothetical protein